MDVVLVAGLWLDGGAWREVAPALQSLGHHPIAVTLPGQGAGSRSATLDDQVEAVVAAVDGADAPVLVVGHSAACSLAWLAADRRPDKIAAVAMIGGFPSADEELYADFFEPVDGVCSFPGWEPFEGPDAADLDEEARARFVAGTVPVPEAVTRGVVRLAQERRYDVPVVLVCPEFTPAQAREWVEGGEVPELARAARVSYVDIDSGHWPMFTQPAELARILAGVAAEGAPDAR